MLTVTKRFEFCYGHHLPQYLGKCKTQHGHNSILEVEVSGTCHSSQGKPYPGMVCDFSILKDVVKLHIIDMLDHQNINDVYIENCVVEGTVMKIHPTAENMVSWIVSVLKNEFKEHLIRVRMYETPDSYAEWRK